jgi:hypothetical protein
MPDRLDLCFFELVPSLQAARIVHSVPPLSRPVLVAVFASLYLTAKVHVEQALTAQGHEKGRNGRMQAMRAKGEARQGMDKKEDFEKSGVGVGLFEPNVFSMRWSAFLNWSFELSPAWLKKPNQYEMT